MLATSREMKRCTKCGKEWPRSGDLPFGRNRSKPDGMSNICTPCNSRQNRQRRESDPEAARQYQRDYYRRNRDRRKAQSVKARKENPQRAADHSQTRRARLADAFVEDVDRKILYERDEGICGICGEAVDPDGYEVDHIRPLSRGGLHSYSNTQVAHPKCNRTKGSII